MPAERFVGLMSGTSLDGVDAALVRFEGDQARVERCLSRPFDPALRDALSALCAQEAIRPDDLAATERLLTRSYVESVDDLIRQADVPRHSMTAIGCHGQTIRHLPSDGFSWQIGNPAQLAVETGLPVVADFRRGDMALGGQGAPLAPAFHQAFFGRSGENRMAVNIGGIANVTLMGADGSVTGWDTGPGNTLLDHWFRRHHSHGQWDEGGHWAASGEPDADLVESLLADAYFQQTPPKSTGPEHFSSHWLDKTLDGFPHLHSADVQASLVEVTCRPIVEAAKSSHAETLIVCGGGACNNRIMSRLDQQLPGIAVQVSSALGIPVDHVESAGFAWLARQHWLGRPGNVPAVTGARCEARLGAMWYPVR
jgi:anhydro-N-acetylmuramic acid kinase